jgi:hypothetical protein
VRREHLGGCFGAHARRAAGERGPQGADVPGQVVSCCPEPSSGGLGVDMPVVPRDRRVEASRQRLLEGAVRHLERFQDEAAGGLRERQAGDVGDQLLDDGVPAA